MLDQLDVTDLIADTETEILRLVGDRDQAWKDLAEYKQRFKDQGDAASLEQLLKGI